MNDIIQQHVPHEIKKTLPKWGYVNAVQLYNMMHGKVYINDNKYYISIMRLTDGVYYQDILQKRKRPVIKGTTAFSKIFDGVNVAGMCDGYIPQYKKPYNIKLFCAPHTTYYNAKHIDFNSFFPWVLTLLLPCRTAIVMHYYNKRHKSNKAKSILNYSIGQLHNVNINLWHRLMDMCNNILYATIQELKDHGCTVLATNTDGIFYQGDYVPPVGTGLGQIKHDYNIAKIRFKSAGCYELVHKGNSQYSACVRGVTKLDTLKPRSQWKWGDIYTYEACSTVTIDKEGIKCQTIN